MLQQTIIHSFNQSIKPCVQSVRVHAAPCAPMCLNSRPCASMRAHASFSTTDIIWYLRIPVPASRETGYIIVLVVMETYKIVHGT